MLYNKNKKLKHKPLREERVMGNTVCCGDASQQNVLSNGIRKDLVPKKNKDPYIENFQQDETEDTGDYMTLDHSSVSGI